MTERETFLNDILITCAEDGCTNPWRRIAVYDFDRKDGDFIVTDMVIEDMEENDARHAVSTETIAHGLSLLRSKRVEISPEMTARILLGDKENDAGNIDAYDADAIMQAGLFEEVIYG